MDLILPGQLIIPATLWVPMVLAAVIVVATVFAARMKCNRLEKMLHEAEKAVRRERDRTVDAEQIRKEEETRARTRSESETHHLQATAQAFRDMVTADDRRELAVHVAHAVKRILGPSQWMVFVSSDRRGEEFTLAASGANSGEAAPVGMRLDCQMGRLGFVARRRMILDVRDFDAAPPIVKDQLAAREPEGFRVDVAAPVMVGDTVAALISMGSPQGSLAGARAALELISECAATVIRGLDTRERALRLENCDELTGLYNKNYFAAHGAEYVYENRVDGVPMTVMHFAIDDFRGYVDRNGHQIGDKLIKALSGSVAPLFREGDLLARWGADEFAALLPGVDAKLAYSIAERMRSTIGGTDWPGATGQPAGRLTICAGVASCPGDGETFDDLMNAAEHNLVTARWAGGDQVAVSGQAPQQASTAPAPTL